MKLLLDILRSRTFFKFLLYILKFSKNIIKSGQVTTTAYREDFNFLFFDTKHQLPANIYTYVNEQLCAHNTK